MHHGGDVSLEYAHYFRIEFDRIVYVSFRFGSVWPRSQMVSLHPYMSVRGESYRIPMWGVVGSLD